MKKLFASLNIYAQKYIFLLILLFASLLRIFQITKRDFWYDEAFTGIAIRDSFSGMMKIIVNDVHPPLYYILVKYFSAPFNYNVLGIRLYSAIFGVLCVAAIYLFAKELFDKKTALWSSMLVAIGPLVIQYSQEARMYSMYCFLIIMAAYFFIKALKTERTSFYFFWGIFLGLAALTHYMSILFALVFYFIFIIWRFKKAETDNKKKAILHYLKNFLPTLKINLGYAVAFLIFSPWLLNFVRSFADANLDWIKPASFGDIFYNIQMFIFGIPPGEMSAGMPLPNALRDTYPSTVLVLIAIFFTGLAAYLFFSKKEIKKSLVIFSLSFGFMFIAYILSLVGSNYFIPRYLLPANYFIFILIASWLSKIKLRYSFSSAALYLVLLQFAIVPVQASEGWHTMTKNLGKYNGKHFYSLNSFDYVIAKYYLGADRLALYNIDWPQYNPYFWAAIGPNFKRTENYADIKNDPDALIIYNVQVKREFRSDKTFDPVRDGFTLVDQYKNIQIYKY